MMSPSSTGSPTNPSGHMDPMMMRPNSSMAQPTAHMGTYNSNQWFVLLFLLFKNSLTIFSIVYL